MFRFVRFNWVEKCIGHKVVNKTRRKCKRNEKKNREDESNEQNERKVNKTGR